MNCLISEQARRCRRYAQRFPTPYPGNVDGSQAATSDGQALTSHERRSAPLTLHGFVQVAQHLQACRSAVIRGPDIVWHTLRGMLHDLRQSMYA